MSNKLLKYVLDFYINESKVKTEQIVGGGMEVNKEDFRGCDVCGSCETGVRPTAVYLSRSVAYPLTGGLPQHPHSPFLLTMP